MNRAMAESAFSKRAIYDRYFAHMCDGHRACLHTEYVRQSA